MRVVKGVHPSLAESFDPRENSIGLLRFALAALVLISHSWPIGGFGRDPLEAWIGRRMTLGQLAVDAFFVISGFLIAASVTHASSTGRYLWHRFLRIFPGFWVCLFATAFAMAPLFWIVSQGTYHGFLSPRDASPWHYVERNFLLVIRQENIGGLFRSSPYPHGINGSLWTLAYEFCCYLGLAVIGLTGLRARGGLFAVATTVVLMILVGTSAIPRTWGVGGVSLRQVAVFGVPFALGSCAWFMADRIPMSRFLAAIGGVVYLASLPLGLFEHVGLIGLTYVILWLACVLPLRGFDRRRDVSYGVYLYAFPVEQGVTLMGVRDHPLHVATAFAITVPLAMLSYRLVERPALRMKKLSLRSLRQAVPRRETIGPQA